MRRYINWIVAGALCVAALCVFTFLSGWLSIAAGFLLALLGSFILEGSVHQLFTEKDQSNYCLKSAGYVARDRRNDHTWIVCLPGMQLDGQLQYQQYVDLLRDYGNVLVVNYPTRVFDVRRIAEQIAGNLTGNSKIDEVVIIGQSLGTPVGLALMQQLNRLNAWPRSRYRPIKVVGFAGVSGFVDARAVKPPVPIWVPYLVRDSVFARWIYPPLMRLFSPQSPIESGGNRQLADGAYRAYCNFPLAGAAAQGRAIAELPQYGYGTFHGTRLGIIETIDDDAVLHKEVAHNQLRRVFADLDARVYVVPGPHACLVEYPTAHRKALKAFLDEVLAENAPGRPSPQASQDRQDWPVAPAVRLPNIPKVLAPTPILTSSASGASCAPRAPGKPSTKRKNRHGRKGVSHKGGGRHR